MADSAQLEAEIRLRDQFTREMERVAATFSAEMAKVRETVRDTAKATAGAFKLTELTSALGLVRRGWRLARSAVLEYAESNEQVRAELQGLESEFEATKQKFIDLTAPLVSFAGDIATDIVRGWREILEISGRAIDNFRELLGIVAEQGEAVRSAVEPHEEIAQQLAAIAEDAEHLEVNHEAAALAASRAAAVTGDWQKAVEALLLSAKDLNKENEKAEELTQKRRQKIIAMIQGELNKRREALKQQRADAQRAAEQQAEDEARAAEKAAAARLEIERQFIQDKNRAQDAAIRAADERAKRLAESEAKRDQAVFERSPTGFVAGVRDEFRAIQEELANLHQRGRMVMADLASGLGQAFENLFFNVAERGFRNLQQTAREFGAEVLRVLAQIAARQAALAAIGGIFGGISPLPALAKGGVLPGEVSRTIPVRAFAAGGVVNEPTMAIFGEGRRSRGEAFVPLPDGRSIPVKNLDGGGRGGGEARTVEVNMSFVSTDPRGARDLFVQEWPTIKNKLIEALNTDQTLRRQIKAVR